MNPLSKQQKEFLYRELVYGRYRFVAKPVYELCMATILWIERFFDLFVRRDRTALDDLTIVIKTFERDRSVNRLVRSIKRRYPSADIVVINDSRNPREIAGVRNLIMPYDSGISAGRNAALDIVQTRYFLLLDDDFVFSRRQDLGLLLTQMEQFPEIDILGGRCIDLPFFIVHDFHNVPIRSGQTARIPIDTMLGDNRVVDKVQNFFIARTAHVKKVLWDERLKTMEHTDFFTRAKGRLVTAYRSDMLILHAKTPFDREYLLKRFRVDHRQN